MSSQYLTVKDFAQAAGVSRQTIYKQMKGGRLSGYVQTVGSQTMIQAEALTLYGVENSQPR